MPQYKLTYFDIRGLGEVIRQIFSYAEVAFEDDRVPMGSLTPEKKIEMNLEWGQLPVLEIYGQRMAQSFAICRHLAKKFKLSGSDEEEAYRCDEIVEAVRDYQQKSRPYFEAMFGSKDPVKIEEAKKTFLEVDTPFYLKRFNSLLVLKENTWLVGNGLTWADIVFVHTVNNFEIMMEVKLTHGYPAVEKLMAAVQNEPNIKAWLAKRPVTKF